jgi:2-octaprenyl-3-methyl-6-methoxy-1,4-benzoquinol hydroxylase
VRAADDGLDHRARERRRKDRIAIVKRVEHTLGELHDLADRRKRAGVPRAMTGARETLRRYERVRRSENAIAAGAFDAINRAYSNDAVLPTLLRGRVLGLVDRLTPLKRLFARHAAGVAG